MSSSESEDDGVAGLGAGGSCADDSDAAMRAALEYMSNDEDNDADEEIVHTDAAGIQSSSCGAMTPKIPPHVSSQSPKQPRQLKRWASLDHMLKDNKAENIEPTTVNSPQVGNMIPFSWGNPDRDEDDSSSEEDDSADESKLGNNEVSAEQGHNALTCGICKRTSSGPQATCWYATQGAKAVGELCMDCGCTCEAFQQEGKSLEDCITEVNANGGRNAFASRFQAALLVQRGINRKPFAGSDVGGRTCVGQKIYFPKLLIMAKDFSKEFQGITPHQLVEYANDLQLGIAAVPNFTGTKPSTKEMEQELGFYIDPSEEAKLPPTLPRFKAELYHDSCTFHDELTLTKPMTLMKEQGLGTFQWLNTTLQNNVVKEWSPCNAKQNMTNKVTWQYIMDAKDKVLEGQRKEELRLQGMGDQGEDSWELAIPEDTSSRFSLSLPMAMGGGVRPTLPPTAKKVPKFRFSASTPRPAPQTSSAVRTKRQSTVTSSSNAVGADSNKAMSRKELLASATCDVKLEDISMAAATVVGKGMTKGSVPPNSPEAHKKFYQLVNVIAILKGEILKKRLNGVHALVVASNC